MPSTWLYVFNIFNLLLSLIRKTPSFPKSKVYMPEPFGGAPDGNYGKGSEGQKVCVCVCIHTRAKREREQIASN